MPKDAKVDVVLQRIEEKISDEVLVEPKHVRRYGVNNIFARSFSYLLGKLATGNFKFIEITAAGALKTASVGAGLEILERNPTSATNGWVVLAAADTKTETFSATMSVIDIMSKSYEIYAELSMDGTTFMPKKLMRGDLNHMKSIDFSCKAVRFSNVNTDAAHNGSFELVGYK